MMRRLTVVMLVVLFSLGLAASAQADGCKNLERDKYWQDGFSKLNELITDKNWPEALDEAHELYGYCDRSPLINFYLGHIYQEMGNDKNALHYLRKATDYTEEFAVKGAVLERIWYERYEAEHSEARPGNIAALKAERDAAVAKLESMSGEMQQSEFDSTLSRQKVRSNYAAGMWTGVGLGIAGLALGGIGGGLILKDYNSETSDAIDFKGDNDKGARVKGSYNALWAMLGAGAGLFVAGTIVAAMMGARYAEIKQDKSEVSFNVSPMHVGFSVTF